MEESRNFFLIFTRDGCFSASKKIYNPRALRVDKRFFNHLAFDKNVEWTILNLGEEL